MLCLAFTCKAKSWDQGLVHPPSPLLPQHIIVHFSRHGKILWGSFCSLVFPNHRWKTQGFIQSWCKCSRGIGVQPSPGEQEHPCVGCVTSLVRGKALLAALGSGRSCEPQQPGSSQGCLVLVLLGHVPGVLQLCCWHSQELDEATTAPVLGERLQFLIPAW